MSRLGQRHWHRGPAHHGAGEAKAGLHLRRHGRGDPWRAHFLLFLPPVFSYCFFFLISFYHLCSFFCFFSSLFFFAGGFGIRSQDGVVFLLFFPLKKDAPQRWRGLGFLGRCTSSQMNQSFWRVLRGNCWMTGIVWTGRDKQILCSPIRIYAVGVFLKKGPRTPLFRTASLSTKRSHSRSLFKEPSYHISILWVVFVCHLSGNETCPVAQMWKRPRRKRISGNSKDTHQSPISGNSENTNLEQTLGDFCVPVMSCVSQGGCEETVPVVVLRALNIDRQTVGCGRCRDCFVLLFLLFDLGPMAIACGYQALLSWRCLFWCESRNIARVLQRCLCPKWCSAAPPGFKHFWSI